MDAIHAALTGQEWSADTLDLIDPNLTTGDPTMSTATPTRRPLNPGDRVTIPTGEVGEVLDRELTYSLTIYTVVVNDEVRTFTAQALTPEEVEAWTQA